MRKHLYGLMLLMACSPLMAAQQITVYGDETVEAQISNTDLNRITLQGDRILEVKSTQQSLDMNQQYDVPVSPEHYETFKKSFFIDQNLTTGEIYIKPAYPDNTDPIDLFVTTEKKHTFSISLLPAKVDAQTIRISPPGTTANLATQWEAQAPYQQTLINLIKTMRLREAVEGYQIEQIENEPLKKSDQKGVKVQLLARYKGSALIGEIHEIVNYTEVPFEIDESTFFATFERDTKSLAVASSSRVVLPNTFTQVYRVVPHE